MLVFIQPQQSTQDLVEYKIFFQQNSRLQYRTFPLPGDLIKKSRMKMIKSQKVLDLVLKLCISKLNKF